MVRWKMIEGYETLYEVSDEGQIKSLKWNRQTKKSLRPKILKTNDIDGYKQVSLVAGDGRITKHFVHRLVAQAFIPNPEAKPEVNHIDGNPSNNKLDNLEWVTHSENRQHSVQVLKRQRALAR